MSRKNTKIAALAVAGATTVMLAVSTQVWATSGIRNDWVARYATAPSGTSASYSNMANGCTLCHATSGGANYNAYGWALKLQKDGGASNTTAFINTESMNSDGVAGTNLAEILASTQPGWTSGPNNTIRTDNTGTTLANQNPAAQIASPTAGYDNVAPCPADTNGDHVVNVTDLLAVIGAWGTCTGCLADTNDDNLVNVTDLLAVIGAWGACP